MRYSVARTCAYAGFAFALTLLVACSDNGKKGAQQAPPLPLVTVFHVVAKDHPYPAEYQGQTQGSRAVEVRSRVTGIIQKKLYDEGSLVKEGQQLFQIERAQYEAVYQEAAARLDKATREWSRIRPLYEKNAVSQKDRDNAKSEFDSATAALRKAKIDLDYCQVLAPVSGYTGKENYTVGNLVNSNTLLTTVNQTNPLYVNFSIPGADVMRSKTLAASGRLVTPKDGEAGAKIKLLDGSIYASDGLMTFVDSQVDPSTGVVKARAEFPNKDGHVLPGQFVRVYLEVGMLKNAILIPQKSVLMTQQGTLVMVVDQENTVKSRPVKLSDTIGNMYLVDSGLSSGERIILEGLLKARDGSKVRVESAAEAANPSNEAANPSNEAAKPAPSGETAKPAAPGGAIKLAPSGESGKPAAPGGQARPAAQDKK